MFLDNSQLHAFLLYQLSDLTDGALVKIHTTKIIKCRWQQASGGELTEVNMNETDRCTTILTLVLLTG